MSSLTSLTTTNPATKAWEEATQYFNENLTKDPKKRIVASTLRHPRANVEGPEYALHNDDHPRATLDELIDSTRAAKALSHQKQWRVTPKIEVLLKWMDAYAVAGDMMMQQQPDVTAVVWGGARFLLKMVTIDIATSEVVTAAMTDVLQHIGRWEEYLQLYSNKERLLRIIVMLFANVLSFLIRARIFFQKATPARYLTALSPFKEKFCHILDTINNLSAVAESELISASIEEQRVRHELQQAEYITSKAERDKQDSFREHQKQLLNELTQVSKGQNRNIQKTMEVQTTTLDNIMAKGDMICIKDQIAVLLKWLQIPKRAAEQWDDGTCEWIFRHSRYISWEATQWCQPLWVHGIPGCGKTVLANYLEERLSVTNNASHNHFAHFFKKSSHEASAHPNTLASSFIAKILRGYMLDKSAVPILSMDILIGLADRYASSMECHFQSLWDALLPLIEKYHSFVMIVDGLDECPETSDQEALLRGLNELSSMPNSKIIVLSRFSLRFRKALGAPVEIVMDANTVRADIRTMVMAEIRRTPKLDPVKERLLDKASRQSNGMFLWARLMLDSVKSASSLNSQNTNLDCFPPGLYAVYDRHLLTQSVGLDSASSRRRRKIFMLLLGSLQPFTVNDVSYILALTAHNQVSAGDLLLDPHAEILRLCYPFASVEDGRLQLIHASVKEYFLKLRLGGSKDYLTEKDVAPLRFSDSQINEYLANKCLLQLSLAQYSSFDLMSTLAAKNLETNSVDTTSQIMHIIGGFYEYACLHWHTHLTAVSTPTQSTLARLEKFLSSSHVVTWSETLFLLKGGIDDGPVIEVRSCLKSWLTLQHFELRETIPVDDFIPASYKRVISTMNKTLDHEAKTLIIGSRLAEYYLWLGDTESAHEMFQTVARGLEAKIGNTSRLLLSQRTKMATCLTVAGRLREAVEKLITVTKLQKQVLGACHKDVFISMSNLGFSEYFLANFANAQKYLQQASDGLLSTTGRTAKEYLYNQLYLGLALERQRQIAASHSLYHQTWLVWMQLSGPDNPATLMTQCALASSYRKLGKYEEAEKHYITVLAARQRSCGLDHFITFDVAIGLAYVYFEMEKFEEAMAIVDLITPLDILRLPAHAERNCQVTHLRGLLASRLSCEETSLAILEDLFVSPHWCRELLWARVSLANLLKAQGKSEKWSSYFDGLICPLQSGKSLRLQEERCLAEAAVQLVRAANYVEANELLASEGYQWIRTSDFYILPGGPITDTA